MTKKHTTNPRILNSRQIGFVAAWTGNATDAARAAGYSHPKASAQQLVHNPAVQEALKEKQIAMAQESGKRLGRQISICRADIINHLWDLACKSASETGNNIYGQIRATSELADIMGMKIKSTPDLEKELAGKTEDEITFFVEHGYFPEPDELKAYREEVQKAQREAS